jgi:tetratricopeptide (TPR) repeat protein
VQHGVDVFGRPGQGDHWAGVQCKLRQTYRGGTFTKTGLAKAVEEAEAFTPPLREFIIATTAPRDAKLQGVAREITSCRNKDGRFSVYIWAWEDISAKLVEFPDVLGKYYPNLAPKLEELARNVDEIKEATRRSLQVTERIEAAIVAKTLMVDPSSAVGALDGTRSHLVAEYHAEVDLARDMIKAHNPKQALGVLDALRKRIWHQAESLVKFRLLTNTGAAKLVLNSAEDAARLFIEALKYNPQEEKALCNAALAHLVLGDAATATAHAREALKRDPANLHAYAILIQASTDDESLDDIIAKVPEGHRKSPAVASAIGNVARNRELWDQARIWCRIAFETNRENEPHFIGLLAEVILVCALQDQGVACARQVNRARREELREALRLFSGAWALVADTELAASRLPWLINQAQAEVLLEDLPAAIRDIEACLRYEPDNPFLIRFRAMLAWESDQPDEAVALLRKIASNKEVPDAPVQLARILSQQKRLGEAVVVLEEFMSSGGAPEWLAEARHALVGFYLALGRIEAARELNRSARDREPEELGDLVDAACVLRAEGNMDEATAMLREAKSRLGPPASFRNTLRVADTFYHFEVFEDAAELYERITDKEIEGPLTRRLLYSYYRSGRTGDALDLCQLLRRTHGPLPYASAMESAIYEDIGDLPRAKEVCQDHLKRYPDDPEVTVRLAVVNFRSRDYAQVDGFLDAVGAAEQATKECAFIVAELAEARGRHEQAIRLLYETRRRFFEDKDAHLRYMKVFLWARGWMGFLGHESASVDSAVCLEDESGATQWLIIEDRQSTNLDRGEVAVTHELAQKIMGRRVGDRVAVSEGPPMPRIVVIREIKSKFVHALHDSVGKFGLLFPNSTEFRTVRFPKGDDPAEMRKALQAILDQVAEHDDTVRGLLGFYKEHLVPVGTLATTTGWNPIDVWNTLVADPGIGLRCCMGTVEERAHAVSLLHQAHLKLIGDLTSVIALAGTRAGDQLVRLHGKIGVALSLIEIIEMKIAELRARQPDGYMILSKQGGSFYRQEITPLDVQRGLARMEAILRWVDENCEVLPCLAALRLRRSQREELDHMIGRCFADSVLLASEGSRLLLSDDMALRMLASDRLGVQGVWTQAALMHCLLAGAMDESAYAEVVIKLAASHYDYTSVDPAVALAAAERSGWLPGEPLRTVLWLLRGPRTEFWSALNVSSRLVHELWGRPIPATAKHHILFALLDALGAGRERRQVCEAFAGHLALLFASRKQEVAQLLSLIGFWTQFHCAVA